MVDDVNSDVSGNIKLLQEHILRLESVVASMNDIGHVEGGRSARARVEGAIRSVEEEYLTPQRVLQRKKQTQESVGEKLVGVVWRFSRRQLLSQLADSLRRATR